MPARRAVLLLCVAFAWPAGVDPASLPPRRRRASGSCCTPARPVSVIPTASTVVVRWSRAALETAGYTVDWEDCTNNGGAASNCDNADKNPRIFTDANLARYDAIVLLNSSAGPPGPLWDRRAEGRDHQVRPERRRHRRRPQRDRHGHHRHDVGLVGRQQRQLGRRRDDARPRRDRPDQHRAGPGRGQQPPRDQAICRTPTASATSTTTSTATSAATHHVLANLDERTYTPGGNAMGQDHPITWCKLYDGDNINDGTATRQELQRRPHVGDVDGSLRRLLHGERRQQQPDQADRRRRPLGRGRGQEVRLLGHRLVVLHAHGARPRREQPDRHRRRQGRQGLLVGDR